MTRPMRSRFARRAIVLSVLALGVPVSLSQLGSTSDARFGASEQLGPNQLAAATVSVAPGRRSVAITVVDMAPGDRARGRIDVVNDGTLPIRYSLAIAFDGADSTALALADRLDIEMWSATACGQAPPSPSSILVPRRSLAPAGRAFGNPRLGPDPGDRTLGVGETETICYAVELDLAASNAVATTRLQQQFVIDAEHDLDAEVAP